jgi:hypothetical protein
MPTITITGLTGMTELEAEPFERIPGVSGQPAQTVSLTSGAGSIVLAVANGADWCWRLTEHGPGRLRTRYCTVAGSSTYAALPDIDPGLLIAAVEPTSPAWFAALDALSVPASVGITYNPDGSVSSVTQNGVTTTYTYNPDGSVATDVRLGVTRAYTYDGSGNLTGITVI